MRESKSASYVFGDPSEGGLGKEKSDCCNRDGTCDVLHGEGFATCGRPDCTGEGAGCDYREITDFYDCGCNYNNICEPERLESGSNCLDCRRIKTCGNPYTLECDVGETRCNCPYDCGYPVEHEIIGAAPIFSSEYEFDGIEFGQIPNICTNGKDDDCDGKIDCADEDCKSNPAGENPGGGNSWVKITATINGRYYEDWAYLNWCKDGIDNDCDEVKDCDEPECAGSNFDYGEPPPSTMGHVGYILCHDGMDNDCDGLIDCADNAGQDNCRINLHNYVSESEKAFYEWEEDWQESLKFREDDFCHDGINNDCDFCDTPEGCCNHPPCYEAGPYDTPYGQELIDCSDPGCYDPTYEWSMGQCHDGRDNNCWGGPDCYEWSCVSYDSNCAEICDDTIDNDGDGNIDCADEKCATDSHCSERDYCEDTVDNDGDLFTDCADPDCESDISCRENVWHNGEHHCADGINNDPLKDDLIDCADPDCANTYFGCTCGNGKCEYFGPAYESETPDNCSSELGGDCDPCDFDWVCERENASYCYEDCICGDGIWEREAPVDQSYGNGIKYCDIYVPEGCMGYLPPYLPPEERPTYSSYNNWAPYRNCHGVSPYYYPYQSICTDRYERFSEEACAGDPFCVACPYNAESGEGDSLCGNGQCDLVKDEFGGYKILETDVTCPADCVCNNDGICDQTENAEFCLKDCHCGNGVWESWLGENINNCPIDSACGDSVCEGEDGSNCPADCGGCLSTQQGACLSIGDCCEQTRPGLTCPDTGAGSGRCCIAQDGGCSYDSECCQGYCIDYTCQPCKPDNYSGCGSNNECCCNSCIAYKCQLCIPDNEACDHTTDCCSVENGIKCLNNQCLYCVGAGGGCDPNDQVSIDNCCSKRCSQGWSCCVDNGETCESDGECCDGYCVDGICASCKPVDHDPPYSCNSDGECCDNGPCMKWMCRTCLPSGEMCWGSDVCCGGGTCLYNTCCIPMGQACNEGDVCCLGECLGSPSTCCKPNGWMCNSNEECCGGTCTEGMPGMSSCSGIYCGDGTCNGTETCDTCPQDCGACQ